VVLEWLHGHALAPAPSFFSCALEPDKGAMHTGATGQDLTAVGIALTQLIKRGIRILLHSGVDDRPPLGIKARRIATAVGGWGITPCTAKPRAQLAHKPRADGQALGQLTDGTVLMVIRGENFLAHIYSIGFHRASWHLVSWEAFSGGRRFAGGG
jgi:hypothetical protein